MANVGVRSFRISTTMASPTSSKATFATFVLYEFSTSFY